MRYTKLNHLLEARIARQTCTETGKLHCWVACGEPRASVGGNMFVNLRCSRCGATESTILNAKQYELQKRIINTSVKEQEYS